MNVLAVTLMISGVALVGGFFVPDVGRRRASRFSDSSPQVMEQRIKKLKASAAACFVLTFLQPLLLAILPTTTFGTISIVVGLLLILAGSELVVEAKVLSRMKDRPGWKAPEAGDN